MRKYTITFFDKTKITIAEVQAKKIQQAILSGSKNIIINDDFYSCTAIAKITKNKNPPMDKLPEPENRVSPEVLKRVRKEIVNKYKQNSH